MWSALGRILTLQCLLIVLLASSACNKSNDSGPVNPRPPSGPGFGKGTGGPSSPIRDIMAKLTKGPQSLTPLVGQELKRDPPPWDEIQPQTKEFVVLAKSMGKYDPPKGSKESWTKLT